MDKRAACARQQVAVGTPQGKQSLAPLSTFLPSDMLSSHSWQNWSMTEACTTVAGTFVVHGVL